MNLVQPEPEFTRQIAKSSFVVSPVPVKVFRAIYAPLEYIVQPLPGVVSISQRTAKAPKPSGSIVYTPVVVLPDLYKSSQLFAERKVI